jgi:hypothetical protein
MVWAFRDPWRRTAWIVLLVVVVVGSSRRSKVMSRVVEGSLVRRQKRTTRQVLPWDSLRARRGAPAARSVLVVVVVVALLIPFTSSHGTFKQNK